MRCMKGYSKAHGERVVCRIYDEPQKGFFDKYIAEVVYADDRSRRTYDDLEIMAADFDFIHQISEAEFEFFVAIGKLSTEIWMAQFTGGFPRENNCRSYERNVKKYMEEVINNAG